MPYEPTPRKMLSTYRDISSDLDGLTLLEAARELFAKSKDHPDAKLDYGRHGSYIDDPGLYLVIPTPETDEQMAERHRIEAHIFLQREQRDAAEFARLSAKFAGKGS